jgi:predicted MPP superfamily phosphohydrolase
MSSRTTDDGGPRISRRRLLKALGAAASALLVGRGGYSLVVERWDLELTERKVAVRGLPGAFDGLRIGLLTDLHLGRFVPAKHVARAVALVAAAHVDLVAVTGDFVGHQVEQAGEAAEIIAELDCPLGIYATLGNHDLFESSLAAKWEINAHGIPVLMNEPREIARGGERVFLVGVNDPATNRDDLYRACHKLPPDETRLLLAHSPDIAPRAALEGIDLILCGHTHGGQIVLPLIGPPIVNIGLGREYLSGLRDWRGLPVYISRGVGMIGPPIRFRCRPEVAIIELRAA